jgi:hypothetical protein
MLRWSFIPFPDTPYFDALDPFRDATFFSTFYIGYGRYANSVDGFFWHRSARRKGQA